MNSRHSLLLVCAVCFVQGCNRETVNVSELESKAEDMTALASKSKGAVSKLKLELKVLEDNKQALEDEVDAMHASIVGLEREKTMAQASFERYRAEYKETIGRRAPGMLIGELRIGTHVYRDVRVKSLDTWELAFMHAEGTGRVALADLPEDLRQRFCFDPAAGRKPLPQKPGIVIPEDVVLSGAKTPDAPPAAGQAAAAPGTKPQAATSKPSNTSVSGRTIGKIVADRYGHTSEIMGTLGGGSSSTGSKIKGAVSPVPEGYQPIGSNLSTGFPVKKPDQK